VYGVTFDVWGTLLDLRRAYAAIADRLAAILGVKPAEALERLRGAAREARRLRRREGWSDARRGAEIVAERLGVDAEELMRVTEEALLDAADRLPLPGAREALALTKRLGVRVGVAGNVLFWPSSLTRRLLEETGLAQLVDEMIFSDEVGASKPNPRFFEEAAGRLGVAVEELVHVGDRPDEDVAGVLAAGGYAVLAWARVEEDMLCIHPRLCAVKRVSYTPFIVARIARLAPPGAP